MRTLSIATSLLLWLPLLLGRAGRGLLRLTLRWIELVGQNPSLARDPGWLAWHTIEHRRLMRAPARLPKSRLYSRSEPCAQLGLGL
jgi:hypothetical protein